MVQPVRATVVALVSGGIALLAVEAPGQPLGPFRWQFAPFCNVVTLTAIPGGPFFSLTGTDDQCGAGAVGTVSGTASALQDGSIAMGLTIVTPGGQPSGNAIVLNSLTLSGIWRDAEGGTGTFAFNPPLPATGMPRPAPVIGGSSLAAGAVMTVHLAPGAVTTEKLGTAAVVTDNIAPAAVTPDKLATGAVTAGVIAPAAVGAAAVNAAQVQLRVNGGCESGAISQVNADGSVTCQAAAIAPQATTGIVELEASFGGCPFLGGSNSQFNMRILPSGQTVPFSIPAGSVLVVTSVKLLGFGGTAGTLSQTRLFKSGAGGAVLFAREESAVNAFGRLGHDYRFATGIVVESGGLVCANSNDNNVSTFGNLYGFLVPAP
jgi:hypothetical protein